MPDANPPEHRGDPRSLSRKHPGRSKIQDDAPPLTPLEFSSRKDQDQKERVVKKDDPSRTDLERREARGSGSMPYGTRGSRKGKPLEDHPPPRSQP